MKLTIVDVFAEARYQGNQLAVVEGAAGLSDALMQDIAREMNFSETTFVIDRRDHEAEVRIFTPGEELPFAGHPTLGTAWVLTGGTKPIVLSLPAGRVPVRFDAGIGWLTPPSATAGTAIAPAAAAELLSLGESDLDPDLDAQIVHCGPTFAIVGVNSLAALQRVHVDLAVQRRAGIAGAAFAVCRGGYSEDADFAARMLFFDGVGIREDAATGSANAAFAHYLLARGSSGRFIVEQGFEIRRPSRIHLRITDGIAGSIEVGGKVQPVAEGRLL
ncbi:MAG: PhzF family phenazine biosynthesis protein [Pseudomonadales bacterium]